MLAARRALRPTLRPFRHRRPVAAGVLAVGLAAAGLIAAPSAQADTGVWIRVAACESSGNWYIHTGNGYYGGLQFSLSTWRAFGGGKYAAYPSSVGPRKQVAVAKRVLAAQGPGAWPVCSIRAGLTRSNGEATSSALPSFSWYPAHHSSPSSPSTTAYASGRSYTVRSGDTLSGIATRLHVSGGWSALWQHNRGKIANPNAIRVGQVLSIP